MQPPVIAHWMRSQYFLGEAGGLLVAAYREAEAAAKIAPDDPRPIDLMRHALIKLGLEGSSPWLETQRALDALPSR